MHPAYATGASLDLSFARLWGEYNRLLGRRKHALVGYDAWIEQVERKGPQVVLEQQQPCVHFAIWMLGDRRKTEACERTKASLARLLKGDYLLLEPTQQIADDDSHCWIVMVQVGDMLAPQALQRLTAVITDNKDAAVIYTDEDRITVTGHRHSPQFKPAWNPDLLYTDPQYSHIWCMRSDVCVSACKVLQNEDQPAGLYALALEATAQVKANQILHLPEVLCHHCDIEEGTKGSDGSDKILLAFFKRRQTEVSVETQRCGGHTISWPMPTGTVGVTAIIPSRDQGEMLRTCIDSVIKYHDNKVQLDIIVVDNDSQDTDTLEYLEHLSRLSNMTIHRRPGDFNYAAINNEAVALARGNIIAFINNDIEAIKNGWLSRMAAQANRPEIGAVGAKLLYPDDTIQHGGILLGIGGVAGHAHKYLPAEADGYQMRLRLAHNLSAVTAAALVMKKSCFEQVGGFDAESFPVNYNDVDLCLRLMAAGYRNIFCPEAVLIHHESRSRGIPIEGSGKYSQWQQERQNMRSRWGKTLDTDPFYSPHLSLVEEDLSLTLTGAMGTKGRTGWVGH